MKPINTYCILRYILIISVKIVFMIPVVTFNVVHNTATYRSKSRNCYTRTIEIIQVESLIELQ